jgi:hypothetical protein
MDERSPSRGPSPKPVPSPEPGPWVVPWACPIIEFIGFLVGFVSPKIISGWSAAGRSIQLRPCASGKYLCSLGKPPDGSVGLACQTGPGWSCAPSTQPTARTRTEYSRTRLEEAAIAKPVVGSRICDWLRYIIDSTEFYGILVKSRALSTIKSSRIPSELQSPIEKRLACRCTRSDGLTYPTAVITADSRHWPTEVSQWTNRRLPLGPLRFAVLGSAPFRQATAQPRLARGETCPKVHCEWSTARRRRRA